MVLQSKGMLVVCGMILMVIEGKGLELRSLAAREPIGAGKLLCLLTR